MTGNQAETFSLPDVVPDVVWLDSVESTNEYLASQSAPSSLRAALSWNQSAGRGRLGRAWISPAGKSLALSLELGPELIPDEPSESWRGALPLITGAQLVAALESMCDKVSLKWPNDVLIDGKKVAGILGQIPAPRRVIIGVGINVWLADSELPTPESTSLVLQGMTDASQLHKAIGELITQLVTTLQSMRQDGVPEDVWGKIRGVVSTLGREARVIFPDGQEVVGTATDLDDCGRLIVCDHSGESHTVSAADVQHLRPV